MLARRILVLFAAPYALWLVASYEYHFIDGVNLAFHEAGHLIFGLFGRTLHFLGGTFGQLFFPIACALHFCKRQEPVEAGVCVIWLGESLMNVGVYLGDAKDQLLPLVGGHIHDWGWLLSRAGLLEYCRGIATGVHLLASGLVAIAWVWMARAAFRPPQPRTPGAGVPSGIPGIGADPGGRAAD